MTTPSDPGASVPWTPERLLAWLAELGIAATTREHPPLMTVEDSKRLRGDLPGGHTKNLFLKDKKDRLWLVVVSEDRRVDLKSLDRKLGSARLSFGSPERLMAHLGIAPGAVTPLALVNDPRRQVTIVIDKALLAHEVVNFHPLTNARTTALKPTDLLKFLTATGHKPHILDFDP
jgi:Ala-tRNA(Pro) deacylase